MVAACCLTSQGSCSVSWSRWLEGKDKSVTGHRLFRLSPRGRESRGDVSKAEGTQSLWAYSGPALIRVATAVKKPP